MGVEVTNPVNKPGVVANQEFTEESEVARPTSSDGDVAISKSVSTAEVAGGRGVEPNPFWDLLRQADYECW